jgi:hypothetical protein
VLKSETGSLRGGNRRWFKRSTGEKWPVARNTIITTTITMNVKTNVTPVIIGATGTISKSFRKYLSSVPGKYGIKELQKTAVLGTAHTHCGKC